MGNIKDCGNDISIEAFFKSKYIGIMFFKDRGLKVDIYVRWLDDSLLDIISMDIQEREINILRKKFQNSKYRESIKLEFINEDKVFYLYSIKPIKITKELASHIIDKRVPEGLFYLKSGNFYVGIDNYGKAALTEDFLTKRKCIQWLKGKTLE